MRISVTHSTLYRYNHPVYLEPHTFRLRPRQDGTQWLHRYALEISPAPAGQTECLDQDGNAALQVWFTELVPELTVRSSFEVETLRENPFDYVLTDPAALPLSYAGPLHAALAPYLGTSDIPQAVREFAEGIGQEAGGQVLAFLARLNGHLFEDFGHAVRAEGPPHAPEFTLREREGTCRDLAMLFCAACHTVGIAARFVSGYEREAATQERAYMHAWVEAYLPGGGWRGYDPTQGLAVAQSHVVVAAAADPRLAAPATGTFRGSATARMEFAIELTVSGEGR